MTTRYRPVNLNPSKSGPILAKSLQGKYIIPIVNFQNNSPQENNLLRKIESQENNLFRKIQSQENYLHRKIQPQEENLFRKCRKKTCLEKCRKKTSSTIFNGIPTKLQ